MSAVEEASPLSRKVMERQITASFDDQGEHLGALVAGQHRDVAQERRLDDCCCYDKRERRREPVGERDDARGQDRGDDERLLEQRAASLEQACQRMIGTQEGVCRRFVVGEWRGRVIRCIASFPIADEPSRRTWRNRTPESCAGPAARCRSVGGGEQPCERFVAGGVGQDEDLVAGGQGCGVLG